MVGTGVNWVKMFEEHIKNAEKAKISIPDFNPNWQWFNSSPLSFKKELKGKIVILDFWTYCCINCIHVLPDLAYLEKKFADAPVAFVGIHSAKFNNEKDAQNIRQSILRYDVEHPVVNDPEMDMWNHLGVHSWPTFIVIGPRGHPLLYLSGEGNRENLEQFIEEALKIYHSDEFNYQPLPIHLERTKVDTTSKLSFPGKLAIDPVQKLLYISDSNHHRIIITDLQGNVVDAIGVGFPGLIDGNYKTARFNRLQGIAYYDGGLYVADAENHALRYVDLKKKEVITLAGNGNQGRDHRGGNKGRDQELSTPWDVCVSDTGNEVYIAMAGSHQIWLYDKETERTRNFSGSGVEQNRNSNNLLLAAWAQPSGITFGNDKLFIADSESSSIRTIDLQNKFTDTLVGGDHTNPANLFCYGDKDGIGNNVRLQHPLGVLWIQAKQLVLIADTYNHRIKALNPITKSVETWAGTGKPGLEDGIGKYAQFYEPSGFALSPDQKTVFIADTNNHKIRILNLETKEVSTL